MQSTNKYSVLAVIGGGLLALMIYINSLLATATSAVNASWLAHGLGGLLALVIFQSTKRRDINPKNSTNTVPKIFYLGGIPGSLTVILASITVNSAIGLTGTLALGLIGQLIFSISSEAMGLFKLKKRKFSLVELPPILLVTLGSTLIILQRG